MYNEVFLIKIEFLYMSDLFDFFSTKHIHKKLRRYFVFI